MLPLDAGVCKANLHTAQQHLSGRLRRPDLNLEPNVNSAWLSPIVKFAKALVMREAEGSAKYPAQRKYPTHRWHRRAICSLSPSARISLELVGRTPARIRRCTRRHRNRRQRAPNASDQSHRSTVNCRLRPPVLARASDDRLSARMAGQAESDGQAMYRRRERRESWRRLRRGGGRNANQ